MITGKAGSKQVRYAEQLYSKKVSKVTVKSRTISELRVAQRSITNSYEVGLKDFNKAADAVHKAKTPGAKKKAQVKLAEIDSRLKQLIARKKKVVALVGRVRKL